MDTEDMDGIEELILEAVKKDKMVKICSIVSFLGVKEAVIFSAIDRLAEKGLIYQPTPESIALV